MMAILAGKLAGRRKDCAPVAGKSTLNRLELSKLEPTRARRTVALVVSGLDFNARMAPPRWACLVRVNRKAAPVRHSARFTASAQQASGGVPGTRWILPAISVRPLAKWRVAAGAFRQLAHVVGVGFIAAVIFEHRKTVSF